VFSSCRLSLILDHSMATAAISGRIRSNEVKRAIVTTLRKFASWLRRASLESTYQAWLKWPEATGPVHQAHVLSYLKLSGKSIGLLINFKLVHLKDGIQRFVNGTDWRQSACVSLWLSF
jgi:hypothetical protein